MLKDLFSNLNIISTDRWPNTTVVGEWMTLRNCLRKEEAQQMHIIDSIDGYLHGIHSFDYVVLWATVEKGKSF